MGGKPKSKSKSSTSKSKSSKSKDKKSKKSSKSSKDSKKKSNKSKDKIKKDKKNSKIKEEEKESENPINNEEKIEKSNFIQDLSEKNIIYNSSQNNNTIMNQLSEKCEGCFQGEGICFCSECGKIFCKTCDDQLHVIPSYRTHERIPLEVFTELKMNCCYHNLPIRLFCESCHEPICKECKKNGPHNTPLHNIGSLFTVYKKFIDIGKSYLNGPLKEKNFKIEELMIQINTLLNENKNKAKEMLHGISMEYENIIEKIIKIDGNKKAELSYNASELQKDILNIQKIMNLLNKKDREYFENGGQKYPLEEEDNDKIINFLLQYKSLVSEIDNIISKPTSKILTKEDQEKILFWPKELNDSKEKLLNYHKYKKLLKVKDDIIWKLLTTPYEEKNPELEEVEKKTNEEISKWTKLIEKTKSELLKYNLVCHFCGIPLEHGMNTPCPLNDNMHPYENRNLTNETPPENYIGIDKHYFSSPTDEYQKQMDAGQFFDINGCKKRRNYEPNFMFSIPKKMKEKDNNDLMRSSISINWVNKAAKIIENENINLFQVLSEYDINGEGYISIRGLILAFQKLKILLTEEDKDSLRKYLAMSGYNEDRIEIKNFAQNFGRTSTYDNLYDDTNKFISNQNINKSYPQTSSNGFQIMTNYNNDNYNNSSIQRSLNSPQINPMMKTEQGFGYSTGIRY